MTIAFILALLVLSVPFLWAFARPHRKPVPVAVPERHNHVRPGR